MYLSLMPVIVILTGLQGLIVCVYKKNLDFCCRVFNQLRRVLRGTKLYSCKVIKKSPENQRTNGPVNAHLISWPSKAQNIQNLEIYGKEMTLIFNTHIPS